MLVTDLSRDVAGRFCTRLLALGGADVVSYPARAPILGSRSRLIGSAPTSTRTSGRWSAAPRTRLPMARTAPRWRRRCGPRMSSSRRSTAVATWDRSDADGVRDLNADVVHVTTSSYGTTGPTASWRGGSLAEWAAGGYLYITGDPSREPLCGPEHLCGYVGGYTAAIAVQAGSILRQRTGHGESYRRQCDGSDVEHASVHVLPPGRRHRPSANGSVHRGLSADGLALS